MASIRRHLTQYLLRCNNFEIMAERIREKIAENGYFQTGTVFQRFDKFKKGYLVPDDFAEFMLDNQIYPTEVELYLIFRDFDKERVGVVTLQRLADQFLPKQNTKLHKKAAQRKYYPPSHRLEIDLQFIIAKYFTHKIQQFKQLQIIRSEMFQKQVFTVQEAFTLIDQQRQGVISRLQQIDRFLRSNGKVVSKDELVRIFRALSFDSSDKILYENFSEHLDPLGKGYYIGYAQRMAEKDIVYRDYIKQKLQLNTEAAKNTRQRVIIDKSLVDLHQSNRRLGDLLKRQQLQQIRQEEQLLSFRYKRNFV